MLKYLIFLAILISVVHSNGYMTIRLKSAFPLNVTVEVAEEVYFPTNKRSFNLQLKPNRVGFVSNIPVKFGRPGLVLVDCSPVEKFQIHRVTLRSIRWNTHVRSVASDNIFLPFTGFRYDIKCNRYWHGLHCDHFCNDDFARTINRRCTQNGTLGCLEGFHGPNCELPVPADSCKCQNGGKCVSSLENTWAQNGSLICECRLGHFEGKHCEKKSFNYFPKIEATTYATKDSHLARQFYNNSRVPNELATLPRL
ncbi:Delta-like protein dsl-1 [Caenorhabditis elegans]|uniref:Delta-like protein dsl-1 n=1 Tax=Caenorhabditis elegans TaxID=6239 RepID=DSL1_CAEEL|nr:Delta-like protein dsl-1 [Caenorhabditis elegans]O45201.1 RecName: Full=Delta-like protein dsl-1; AltName: Full=DSL-domain containing protein dsl-1; Flags: Precursor [Caenorhabditis elegans]CCD74020.1 Delta-like protein dsl-1 [Caenorhabditis elegans]|eukprot:NP_500054.1 Delta-like protein [Caenorhabditis elegans]